MIKNKKASGRRWEEGKGILRPHYCSLSSNALRLKEESADERGFSLDKKDKFSKTKKFILWLVWQEYRKEAIHDSDIPQHDISKYSPTAKQLSSYCVYLIQ